MKQEDGSYDVKFHDQLLGEKKGLPIEETFPAHFFFSFRCEGKE